MYLCVRKKGKMYNCCLSLSFSPPLAPQTSQVSKEEECLVVWSVKCLHCTYKTLKVLGIGVGTLVETGDQMITDTGNSKKKFRGSEIARGWSSGGKGK